MSINGITNKGNEEMMNQISGLSDVKWQTKAGKISGEGLSGISQEEVKEKGLGKDVLSERVIREYVEVLKGVGGDGLREYGEKLVGAGIVRNQEEGERLLRLATSGNEKLEGVAERQLEKVESSKVYEARSIVNSYKWATDYDVRELMKVLIQAFSELMSTQRQADLSALTGIVNTLTQKIEAMEEAKSAQFKSTLASAIGSIVAGGLTVGFAVGSAVASAWGPTQTVKAGDTNTSMEKGSEILKSFTQVTKSGAIAEALGGSAQGVGQVTGGIGQIISAIYANDKSEAEIAQTVADATLEVWRKAQEQGQKTTEALMNFINNLLSMIQQLNQSVSSTEKAIVQS